MCLIQVDKAGVGHIQNDVIGSGRQLPVKPKPAHAASGGAEFCLSDHPGIGGDGGRNLVTQAMMEGVTCGQ